LKAARSAYGLPVFGSTYLAGLLVITQFEREGRGELGVKIFGKISGVEKLISVLLPLDQYLIYGPLDTGFTTFLSFFLSSSVFNKISNDAIFFCSVIFASSNNSS